MCSSTLGPAIEPSLLTCPTRNSDVFSCFANRISRAAAHLGHAARARLHVGGVHRLNGIYNHRLRLKLRRGGEDDVQVRLGENEQAGILHVQARRAHAHLLLGLLARHIQDCAALKLQGAAHLQQQRRFPDAGVAPTSTALPGTTPPPSTRSSSGIP